MQDTIDKLKRDIFNIVKLHKQELDTHNQLKEINKKLEEIEEKEDD